MAQFKTVDTASAGKQDVTCNETLREVITYDVKTDRYTIPRDLILDKLPKNIVDSFLDFLHGFNFTNEELSVFLSYIRDGKLTVVCE